MSDKKVIAFFGGLLYEEKNYKFFKELGKLYPVDEYLLIAFSYSSAGVWTNNGKPVEYEMVTMTEKLNLAAVILQLEYIRNDEMVRQVVEMAHRRNIPVIAMERPYAGCINVALNHKAAFKDLVMHVIEKHNCRKIYLIAGIKGEHFSEDRIQAYREVMAEHGLEVNDSSIKYGDYLIKAAHDAMKEYIDAGDIPEAVICASDQMALGVCEVLEDSGIKIPDEIIVTGYDGIFTALFHEPSITTVEPDFVEEARIIKEKINDFNGVYDNEVVEIGHILRISESCGCIREDKQIINHKQISELSDNYYDINWAVDSMNALMLSSSSIESMPELASKLKQTLWFWDYNYQFVGIKSSIYFDRPELSEDSYITLFNCNNGEFYENSAPYSLTEFIPNFSNVVTPDLHYICVRLLYINENVLGYVAEGAKTLTHRNLHRVQEYGMFLASAVNNVVDNRRMKKLYAELENSSIMDYLTGIYNRRGFYRSLRKITTDSVNYGKYLTLLSIDMDRLKYINDNFGHEEGDFALKQVADSMKFFVYENGEGICARYGGDEFACAIVSEKPLEMEAEDIDKYLTAIANKNDVVRIKQYEISSSVGKSKCILNESVNIDLLMKIADEEMYKNKMKKKEIAR